jgi:hypothetical protein
MEKKKSYFDVAFARDTLGFRTRAAGFTDTFAWAPAFVT